MSILNKTIIVILLITDLFLVGCSSSPDRVSKDQFSGFLGTYGALEEHEDELGSSWQWISPELSEGLKTGLYDSAYVDDIGYYPAPRSNKTVSAKTLIEIARYYTKVVRAAVGSEIKLLDKPAKGSIRLQIAITGVTADADTLKGYKYNPVSRVFGDKKVKIFIETKVTDATTGELLGLAVREGFGSVKENKSKKLTLNGVKSLLDQWATHIKKVASQLKRGEQD